MILMELSCLHRICFYNYILFMASDLAYPIYGSDSKFFF